MHPLHEYVAKQLADQLKEKRILVFYDPRRELAPFVAELRGGPSTPGALSAIAPGGVAAKLVEYDRSFLQLRNAVEPSFREDEPEALLLYLPGVERDRKTSVLMELEKAGDTWEPQLKRLARNVLRQRYTDGVIDEMLASDQVTYEDLARAAADTSTHGGPSLLKAIFDTAGGADGILVAWLSSDSHDVEIGKKGATEELRKLVRSRLGLTLAEDLPVGKLRLVALRYLLAAEFRGDLGCAPPSSLEGVPSPANQDEMGNVREIARMLRASQPSAYEVAADRVEGELGLGTARLSPEMLGAIDTFRFEERALLGYCGELIADKRFDEAMTVVAQREHSFWLLRDDKRRAHWEACRLMAELGKVATEVGAGVVFLVAAPERWVDAYTAKDTGWYRLDLAQRRLEAWVAGLHEDPEEKPLGVVRRAYEDTCSALALGFTRALKQAAWATPSVLAQTRIWPEVVSAQPKPVAYFLVDAMRFEMGVELAEKLPKASEVSLRPAVVALPSITVVGMAALLPGASASFAVVEKGGDLGSQIDDAFLPDLTARKKVASARIPGLVDLTLDDLLKASSTKLTKLVLGAQVVLVRSQEIDAFGEAGLSSHARSAMNTVIDNLARAIAKLAAVGVEHAVVTADHGHLFFAEDRDEAMRADSPGGAKVELHRRCWIGRGGANPAGCIRVTAAELGYASDLDFVFPSGSGIFKSNGDASFHHGGPSLQEMVIPVLAVRSTRREAGGGSAKVDVSGAPEAVTNRIFSVSLQTGKNLMLFSGPVLVRPLLVSNGRQVGVAGMAVDADLDRSTGVVTLRPGTPATIAFRLTDDAVGALRIVVQDAASDAELWRSPQDIPVRLGV